ncbi:uncharacterized protein FOMMEDRAFT_18403 [Fomitiporia mediterranea MF3/22]|uniref:uncharacterized protein n=1 Tax=Fomitiporia mediterranea (strain MF3/22) TaxID=694068 RepID=UPI00044078ED|nr:uncharacterized protein FOMMEDRAFT_18403 [Fomitiporia mediterranea MF3/22]EJD06257.1 hypothetical protein FOMMEDRAFT_18403 [Fomitiporia mediterranea MF3/22]
MSLSPAAHPAHGAQGFLLLTLNDVTALLPGVPDPIINQLALECVTLPENPAAFLTESERDVWLILRVGPHEMVISPTQVVRHIRKERTFIFENGTSAIGTNKKWTLKLPNPHAPAEVEDLETFEVILSQYAAVQEVDAYGPPPAYSTSTDRQTGSVDASTAQSKRPVPPPPTQSQTKLEKPPLPPRTPSPLPQNQKNEDDLRGRLVLVDEEDGEIVGSLGEQFNIREDDALQTKGREKDPVFVEIPSDEELARRTEVYVHPVPIEQQDMLMKTASLISRGIVLATDALTTGMGVASSFYIAHTKPNEKPLEFSERTRGHVQRVHKISGKAVDVTARTTGLIHDAIGKAVDYMSGSNKGKGRVVDQSRSHIPLAPGAPPPRLPLKNRIFLSTDMLLTTVEQSAKQLIEQGTLRVSEALGHKYGNDMRDASYLAGQSVRNVGIVYIDARGVGRRALLKKAGARYIKAKLGKKDVVLGVDEQGIVQESRHDATHGPYSYNTGTPDTMKYN